MILAGGMGAWAGYITPLNSGAGPMTMYTMRRYGVPLPVAVTSTFMSFVATIALLRHRRARWPWCSAPAIRWASGATCSASRSTISSSAA